jgi:plasmid stabilization system protein ParE
VKVAFTTEAESDLQDIGDWIALDSNKRAIDFIRKLRSACTALGDLPRAYPLLPRPCPIADTPQAISQLSDFLLDQARAC